MGNPPDVHTSFAVRSATDNDTDAINSVRNRAWSVSYRGVVSDDYLDSLATERGPRREPWWLSQERNHAFVAEQAGVVVGCAISGPIREPHLHYEGETYVLYVAPEYQRRGIGRQLLRSCVIALAGESCRSMIVWTFKEGFATRFYETLGGIRVGSKTAEIAGSCYEQVAYGWEDLDQLVAGALACTASGTCPECGQTIDSTAQSP